MIAYNQTASQTNCVFSKQTWVHKFVHGKVVHCDCRILTMIDFRIPLGVPQKIKSIKISGGLTGLEPKSKNWY